MVPDDRAIAAQVLALIEARAADATICPSEVARLLAAREAEWRALMPDVRRVVATLADQGRVSVTAGGMAVDARVARGPIRVGRAPTGD